MTPRISFKSALKRARRRWYTRAKYAASEHRTSISGKDWSFLPGFASIADLAHLDPQVERLYATRLRNLNLIKAGAYGGRAFAAFRSLDALFAVPYSVLICIPWLKVGGAERVAANLAHGIRAVLGPDSAAVLVLDHMMDGATEASARAWFPADVPVIEIPELASLEGSTRLDAMAKLLCALGPKTVVAVNSRTIWDCFLVYGGQLSQHMHLGGCLFCNDYDSDGAPGGYAVSYFRETLPHLRFVISDQNHFVADLARSHGLIANERRKLHCLYQYVSAPLDRRDEQMEKRSERLRRPPSYRRQILWAGRIARQKNPELLLEIARRLPSCDFNIFGTGEKPPRAGNIFYHGPYTRFEDLPLPFFDVFLYTSRWDGLPNVLLEAAAHGLPVVAPLIGGIGELVSERTAWPVRQPDDAAEFVARLRNISFAFDSSGGDAKVKTMAELIRTRHSFQEFRGAVAALMDGLG